MKQIIFYTALNGHCYIREWLLRLRNKGKAHFEQVNTRIHRTCEGNFGDHKSLGNGLCELRFANGLRIYYTQQNNLVVVLFQGGSKKSQPKDIAKARELLAEFKAR